MPRTLEIHATFADPSTAEAAAISLLEAGIPKPSINLQHDVLPEARQREGTFLWRILLLIVLWSIAGAIPGAAFGLILSQTIGPEGTAGLIVQLVSWIVVGHLIGGMLAGYFLLADRTQREMPPDRPVSLLTIRGLDTRHARKVRGILHSYDPQQTYASEQRAPSRSS